MCTCQHFILQFLFDIPVPCVFLLTHTIIFVQFNIEPGVTSGVFKIFHRSGEQERMLNTASSFHSTQFEISPYNYWIIVFCCCISQTKYWISVSSFIFFKAGSFQLTKLLASTVHYPSVIVETPSCFLGLIYASYIDNGVCIIDFQISGLLAIGDGGITYSRDR